jgi:hypothetical protein
MQPSTGAAKFTYATLQARFRAARAGSERERCVRCGNCCGRSRSLCLKQTSLFWIYLIIHPAESWSRCGMQQVCIRGAGLFSGYYKEPTMTAETMGGWLVP